jgi:hypothetical protein
LQQVEGQGGGVTKKPGNKSASAVSSSRQTDGNDCGEEEIVNTEDNDRFGHSRPHMVARKGAATLSEPLAVAAACVNDTDARAPSLTKQWKKKKKVIEGMTFSERKRKCTAVAQVNHNGHVDWLLSCKTLVCNEGCSSSSSSSFTSNNDNHNDGNFDLIERTAADELDHILANHQHDDASDGHRQDGHGHGHGHGHAAPPACATDHDHDVASALEVCPEGCDLRTRNEDSNNAWLCEHIASAPRMWHNDHWDYMVKDRLLHVLPTSSDRASSVALDHGSFDTTEDLSVLLDL